jgi:hypothetical protein
MLALLQVLEAAAERLQDYDDKVRIAAVHAVAAVAADSYSGVPQQVMEAASMRLRDTKLPVRKAALAALLGVFKAKLGRSEWQGRGVGRHSQQQASSGCPAQQRALPKQRCSGEQHDGHRFDL